MILGERMRGKRGNKRPEMTPTRTDPFPHPHIRRCGNGLSGGDLLLPAPALVPGDFDLSIHIVVTDGAAAVTPDHEVTADAIDPDAP